MLVAQEELVLVAQEELEMVTTKEMEMVVKKVTKLAEGESVTAAVERSIAAAGHLTAADAGAVEALRGLAQHLDRLRASGGLTPEGKLDTISWPTFLRYCEQLGLTPSGREKLGPPPVAEDGKLAELQARYRARIANRRPGA